MPSLDSMPQLPGVGHRLIDVRGVSLHVAEAGDPAAEPIVLLHGWPQHWWSWRHLIGPLAERYRVIVPDLRGWGWSQAPPGRYYKQGFADDILALLDTLGLERIRLIGHDWGGYTSFLLALAHPQRISRMVALDIVPPWRGGNRPRYALIPVFISYQLAVAMPVLGARTMTRSNDFIRAILRTASGRGMRWSDAELDEYARVLREPARARASSACYRTFLTREVPHSLLREPAHRSLEVQSLLIMGGASFLHRTFRPAPARNLEVVEIDGAGHLLPEEAPERVLALALPFLAGA